MEPISLADGVKEVIAALNSLSELETSKINGLVPSEVTVVFNITAGSKETKTASIEIVPTGIVDQTTTLGGGWTSELTESKGNTITIKFRNIVFANEKELLAKKTPQELTELYEELKKLGWNIHLR
jgi:predicted ABC-class ATPase